MQQEFSWSGLVLSLSIAFFIVAGSSYSISLFVPRDYVIEAAVEGQNAVSAVMDMPNRYNS